MSTHDESLELDPLLSQHDFPRILHNMDSLFDVDNNGVLASSQAGEIHHRPSPLGRLSQLADAAISSKGFGPVPIAHAVEGKRGLLVSVYTSCNIMTASVSRTRVGALKFDDVADRVQFMHQILERLHHAKARLHQNFGFRVRSCTYVVEDKHLWVVLIGLTAISFGKWFKVYSQLRALDIKTVCVQRASTAGTQTSLETAADMFGRLTSVEELARNEILCEGEAETDAPKRGKKRKAQQQTPVTQRAREAVSPPRGGKVVRAVQFDAPEPEARSLVDECVAFLCRRDMSSVREHHDRLLAHLATIPDGGQMGVYVLSGRPLELFARVVHLHEAVLRALWTLHGIDGRASLGMRAVFGCPGYHGMPPDSQAALRSIGQCVDHERNFPVFTLLDTVSLRAPGAAHLAHARLGRASSSPSSACTWRIRPSRTGPASAGAPLGTLVFWTATGTSWSRYGRDRARPTWPC